MPSFQFKICNTSFTILDLGNELNSEFIKLHTSFLTQQPFNSLDFERVAISYFDSHPTVSADHDAFFNNFTILWRFLIELGRFSEGAKIWEFALSISTNWEKSNAPRLLHKGTPYYFLAMTVILKGDLERGFLIMHQALSEDIRTFQQQNPDTPANAFVTLDFKKQEQAFRSEVQDTANLLNELVAS